MAVKEVVFGGGCFWCTEAIFENLKGVVSVVPGYSGGTIPNPSYDQVCGGQTGHAEVVKIEYDPAIISFNDLLTVFFATHDPTTADKQGNDVGTQYRSAIFYTDEEQRKETEDFIADLSKSGPPVITELKSLEDFYPAEDYHKRYYEKNSSAPYCQIVINPKMDKLRDKFQSLIKEK